MTEVRSSKQFTRTSCGREGCPLRTSGFKCHDKCYQEGIVYVSFCKLCETQGKASVYIGESSRTLFTRTGQHHSDFLRQKRRLERDDAVEDEGSQTSWILDHVRNEHGGETESSPEKLVNFRVLSSHPDPFTRQTVEAVWIQEALERKNLHHGKKTLKISSMNRKGEFFCARERWDSRRGVRV